MNMITFTIGLIIAIVGFITLFFEFLRGRIKYGSGVSEKTIDESKDIKDTTSENTSEPKHEGESYLANLEEKAEEEFENYLKDKNKPKKIPTHVSKSKPKTPKRSRPKKKVKRK